jgi:endonuclease/exonuclease/phosphatase (EEP) superfamily protein YafD
MEAGDSSGGERVAVSLAKQLVSAATALALIGLAAAWAMTWLPAWPFTLLEHFRVQYVVAGAVLLGAVLALRMRGWADVAAIATLVHGLPLAADLTRSPRSGPAGGAEIRVLMLNVLTENRHVDQVRQLIADEKPDVVGLVEVDERWIAAVAPAVSDFPGRLEAPRRDNFGVALYARGPMTGAIERLGSGLPCAVAEVAIRDARLRVVLMHPVPPVDADAMSLQESQVAAVAERVRGLADPVLVMGDFNTTPWSRVFARLVETTGLCDSRAGFGIQASFPSDMAVMRIPIDHLLASCAIGVRARRIGPRVGSDHLPVIVDLTIPR